jgi:hypothetical protein
MNKTIFRIKACDGTYDKVFKSKELARSAMIAWLGYEVEGNSGYGTNGQRVFLVSLEEAITEQEDIIKGNIEYYKDDEKMLSYVVDIESTKLKELQALMILDEREMDLRQSLIEELKRIEDQGPSREEIGTRKWLDRMNEYKKDIDYITDNKKELIK